MHVLSLRCQAHEQGGSLMLSIADVLIARSSLHLLMPGEDS